MHTLWIAQKSPILRKHGVGFMNEMFDSLPSAKLIQSQIFLRCGSNLALSDPSECESTPLYPTTPPHMEQTAHWTGRESTFKLSHHKPAHWQRLRDENGFLNRRE